MYYTSWDLYSGYYQIMLDEDSGDMTSFTAPSGLRYRFTRCPFGLSTSPSAMLTVLVHVLSRLRHNKQVYSYMDDVLSGGKDFPDLLNNMRNVFETFQSNNLKCNPRKCNFAATSIQYLGFELTPKGLKILTEKVKIVQALKPPKDRKSLQRLLGLFNFWRRFIKNYSQRTVHLRALLHKDETYFWSEACQK